MKHPNTGAAPVVQKKKKEGRFNVIDFLIVLLILLLIISIVYMFSPISWVKRLISEETTNIYYTVEFQGVNEEFLDKISENQSVVNAVSKNAIGTVTAVDYYSKYTELQLVELEEGDVGILAEYPNRYNVTVTVYASAEYAEGTGYSVNGQRIAVGEKLSLRFPDFSGEGYCIGLNRE